MNDYYFINLANNHHKEAVRYHCIRRIQRKAGQALPCIGTCAVVSLALYWLSTLGV